jgi:L-asparaginase II
VIVQVTRGDLVESEHVVAACARDARGVTLFETGDVASPVYMRSAAKPFIAAAIVAAGAPDAFGLDEREIAIVAASHSGEPFHIEAVRSLLEKIEMPESALRCGAHLPYNEAAAQAMIRRGEAPRAVHNNCSGKHAGILALCKLIGADTRTYLEPSNPSQREILAFCARISDDDSHTWPVAIDGCGIPVYATPLRNAALAFSRLASPAGIDDADARALEIVRNAMTAYPEYVAGSGEFDTELMRAGEGTIASKGGAEGVHGIAIVERGAGYASKVLDGAGRARAPSSLAAMRRLVALDAARLEVLARFAHPVVYNRAGKRVGEIRVVI